MEGNRKKQYLIVKSMNACLVRNKTKTNIIVVTSLSFDKDPVSYICPRFTVVTKVGECIGTFSHVITQAM